MILRMTPILNPPQEGQENYYNYGFKTDITEQDVMETGVGTLAYAYYYDDYVTYPVGFAKNVRISETEKQEIADIIYDLTGVKADEIEDNIASYFQENDIQTTQYKTGFGLYGRQALVECNDFGGLRGCGGKLPGADRTGRADRRICKAVL